jgi:hypothetical protein
LCFVVVDVGFLSVLKIARAYSLLRLTIVYYLKGSPESKLLKREKNAKTPEKGKSRRRNRVRSNN